MRKILQNAEKIKFRVYIDLLYKPVLKDLEFVESKTIAGKTEYFCRIKHVYQHLFRFRRC